MSLKIEVETGSIGSEVTPHQEVPMVRQERWEEIRRLWVRERVPVAEIARRLDLDRKLKGIGLHHFAAFFKRSYRENDYLWGRLDAAERLAGLLLDDPIKPGLEAPAVSVVRFSRRSSEKRRPSSALFEMSSTTCGSEWSRFRNSENPWFALT